MKYFNSESNIYIYTYIFGRLGAAKQVANRKLEYYHCMMLWQIH